ncbi:bifunctional phosphopantothenoylcysteine decarboxylase/phosphopantothenate--cysteine ligase CoaBC [candidate division KSB1 bacterium]|nr:bifunctional phosphopantothenoylcysteine decarboxylase/phosphopantothenate--cysteine ligase CoaBC [candidate division KSB1 bacterium]
MFFEKKILVGVTGGIAAYKAVEVIRLCKSARIRVVMTPAAVQFVNPLTFKVLSENDVLLDLFDENSDRAVHIDWARWADVIVICPATANTVAKVAAGIADNALTTIIAASDVPVIFCPAMNKVMYENPIYRANEEKLKRLGYHFIASKAGELACGEVGPGRMAEPQDIVRFLREFLAENKDFTGKKILVTAGPTQEPLDPVRFISNPSTGKMGYAIARRAASRGAIVTLVSGPTSLASPESLEVVSIKTAAEMEKAVMDRVEKTDILIMAAAVSDFRPVEVLPHKLKKSEKIRTINLEKTADILALAGKNKNKRIHVGFSVETQNEIENSRIKLREKNLDLIVINNPLQPGAGFQVDTNRVFFLDRDEMVEELPLLLKTEVADRVLSKILNLMNE